MSDPRNRLAAYGRQFAPPLVLMVITLVFIVTAYGYSPASRAVPLLVGYGLLGLLGLDIVSRTSTRSGAMVARLLNPGSVPAGGIAPNKAAGEDEHEPTAFEELMALGWVAAFTAAVMVVGILPAVPAYIAAYMIIQGRKDVKLSLLLAGGITLFLWLSFEWVLSIPLYRGLLFGGW